nr:histone chaperone ASF1 [Cryptococcus depauperatus CBS 7841]
MNRVEVRWTSSSMRLWDGGSFNSLRAGVNCISRPQDIYANQMLTSFCGIDLDWRLIYVGSASSEEFDQELDNCSVGPIPAGINAFDFSAPAPQHHLLPSIEPDEILGVTVIIITASYREKEFVRVGYYVNTYYEDEELKDNPPSVVQWDRLYRNVLIEKPKVTRFQNPWDNPLQSNLFDTQTTQVPSSAAANPDLFNTPLPPPIQRAVPALGGSDENGGMEVDHSVTAA